MALTPKSTEPDAVVFDVPDLDNAVDHSNATQRGDRSVIELSELIDRTNPNLQFDQNAAWPTAITMATLAALKSNATIGDAGTAKPTTAFTSGQYVTLANGSLAHWNGTIWAVGAAA